MNKPNDHLVCETGKKKKKISLKFVYNVVFLLIICIEVHFLHIFYRRDCVPYFQRFGEFYSTHFVSDYQSPICKIQFDIPRVCFLGIRYGIFSYQREPLFIPGSKINGRVGHCLRVCMHFYSTVENSGYKWNVKIVSKYALNVIWDSVFRGFFSILDFVTHNTSPFPYCDSRYNEYYSVISLIDDDFHAYQSCLLDSWTFLLPQGQIDPNDAEKLIKYTYTSHHRFLVSYFAQCGHYKASKLSEIRVLDIREARNDSSSTESFFWRVSTTLDDRSRGHSLSRSAAERT